MVRWRAVVGLLSTLALLIPCPFVESHVFKTSEEAKAAAATAQARLKELSAQHERVIASRDALSRELGGMLSKGADTRGAEKRISEARQRLSKLSWDKATALTEMRQGFFCTGCSRTRSDILANDPPPAVFPHPGQHIRPATRQELDSKANEFDEKISEVRSELEMLEQERVNIVRQHEAAADSIRQHIADLEKQASQLARAESDASSAADDFRFMAKDLQRVERERDRAAAIQKRAMDQMQQAHLNALAINELLGRQGADHERIENVERQLAESRRQREQDADEVRRQWLQGEVNSQEAEQSDRALTPLVAQDPQPPSNDNGYVAGLGSSSDGGPADIESHSAEQNSFKERALAQARHAADDAAVALRPVADAARNWGSFLTDQTRRYAEDYLDGVKENLEDGKLGANAFRPRSVQEVIQGDLKAQIHSSLRDLRTFVTTGKHWDELPQAVKNESQFTEDAAGLPVAPPHEVINFYKKWVADKIDQVLDADKPKD